jgi:hypothetical protein
MVPGTNTLYVRESKKIQIKVVNVDTIDRKNNYMKRLIRIKFPDYLLKKH